MLTVKARIASTEPVPKYPGWRLSRQALDGLAARLKTGDVPMLFDHDARKTVSAKFIDANVVAAGPSNWALEAEFEIDAHAWNEIQDRFNEAGVPGGFSFTASAGQAESPSGKAPAVILAADAAAWTDQDRARAGAALEAVAPTRIERLFQYSSLELATIFLILEGVGLSILGNAAYDAVKHLIGRHNGPTRIEVHRHTSGGDTTKAIVTTSDPEIAREALETLHDSDPAPAVLHFDCDTYRWLDQ